MLFKPTNMIGFFKFDIIAKY